MAKVQDKSWWANLENLKKYQKEHGQKRLIKLVLDGGVLDSANDDEWNAGLKRLIVVARKEKSLTRRKHPKLHAWVCNQKQRLKPKTSELMDARIRKLEMLGFDLSRSTPKFMKKDSISAKEDGLNPSTCRANVSEKSSTKPNFMVETIICTNCHRRFTMSEKLECDCT